MDEWLTFNLVKIKMLKDTYEGAMEAVREMLPDVNLNSRNEVLNFFESSFNIKLKSSKIAEINNALGRFDSDSEDFETIIGIVYYMKMKYLLKNYINCVLTHADENGKVMLRDYFGIAMPNRQKLPYSPEVLECLIEGSSAAMEIININRENNKSM